VAFSAIARVEHSAGMYHVHATNDEVLSIASTREAEVLETLTQRGFAAIKVMRKPGEA
jgi:hypothetical protein